MIVFKKENIFSFKYLSHVEVVVWKWIDYTNLVANLVETNQEE